MMPSIIGNGGIAQSQILLQKEQFQLDLNKRTKSSFKINQYGPNEPETVKYGSPVLSPVKRKSKAKG